MRLVDKRIFSLAAISLAVIAGSARASDSAEGKGTAATAAPVAAAAIQTAVPIGQALPLIDPRSAAALNRSLAADRITLPAGGVEEACAGFPTLFRCVAALHLAQNVKVGGGFAPVREMLLYDNQASIADAARAFAPDVDPLAAEKTAQGQAMRDLRKIGVVR
ncbi:MAG: hypothetical protein ABL914_07915 [Novosphingobium sp.]|uniref:hypothetical protein n=1 Tax=Novosphingobium sp. TaxID=1874826 RepID=UPI0032BC72C3